MSDRLLIVCLDLSPYAAAMREHSSGAFLGEGSIQRKHDCAVCIDFASCSRHPSCVWRSHLGPRRISPSSHLRADPVFPSFPLRMELAPIQGRPGGVWDQEGRYHPSEGEVQGGIVRWQMQPTAENEAHVWHWIKALKERTWLATALYFPYVWQGTVGVFLCLSNPTSTRQSKENCIPEYQRRCGGIPYPEYLFYDVYFYPGMRFGNLCDFMDDRALRLGLLANVLVELCGRARVHFSEQDVFVRPGAWVYGGFRALMQRLRVPVHAEVVSGLSYRRLASLDVFMGIHTAAMGIEPSPMALWTVSNEDADRIPYYPQQDQWWHMPVWRPAGQPEQVNIMDYPAEVGMPPNSNL